MRFEHLIEINSPDPAYSAMTLSFTRAQLWLGLMQRVKAPQRLPNGPVQCDWAESEPGLITRTLRFGPHTLKDQVRVAAEDSLVFTPEAHGDTAPIRLTIRIEEPQPRQMVLRFVYEALGAQTDEEAYYNDYRHSAWLHNDRDMVTTLREWLEGGELRPLDS